MSLFLSILALVAQQAGPIPLERFLSSNKDLFAEAIKAKGLSAATIRSMIHPFTGKALVGTPLYTIGVSVTPDGAILVPTGPFRFWFQAFVETEGVLKPMFAGGSRSWSELWSPIVENRSEHKGLIWRQQVFVTPEAPGRELLVVRLECENVSGQHVLVGPVIGFANLTSTAAPWVDPAQTPSPAPVIPSISRTSVSVLNYHLAPLPRLIEVSDGGLPEPWMGYRMTLVKQPIAAGDTEQWVLLMNLWESPSPHAALDLQAAFAAHAERWKELFSKAAEYSVPDRALVLIRNQLLMQLLNMAAYDVMSRGGFPSALSTEPVGIQEAWAILAIAEWGLGFEAATLCDGTLFTEEFNSKTNKHHQYRAGIQGRLAWDVYCVTGDKIWLEVSLQWLRRAADWIVEQSSKHDGMLPLHRLGYDVDDAAYGLWPNAICWRGLRDTSLALERLGYKADAQKYASDALNYRRTLLQRFQPIATSGYIPLALEDTPDKTTAAKHYAQHASLLLETSVLGNGSAASQNLIRYLERTGRIQAGLPTGLDQNGVTVFTSASLGLQLARLHSGDSEGFLRGVYGMLALGMDSDWFTGPEYVKLMTREEAEAQRRAQESRFALTTEPSCALPAVLLQCLRRMFVYEERDTVDVPTGVVRLLPAIPDRWLDPNQTKPFYVKKMPTVCGKVSVVVMPEKDKITYRIRHHGAGVYGLKEFKLRVPSKFRILKVEKGKARGESKDGWLPLEPAEEIVVVVTR